MDPRTYLTTFGTSGAQELVGAVAASGFPKFNISYFRQIAYRYRRPSIDLAQKMVEKDPRHALDLLSLLQPRVPSRPRKAKKTKVRKGDGHVAPPESSNVV